MVVRPRDTPKKHFMGKFLAAGLSGTGTRIGAGAFVTFAGGRIPAPPQRVETSTFFGCGPSLCNRSFRRKTQRNGASATPLISQQRVL